MFLLLLFGVRHLEVTWFRNTFEISKDYPAALIEDTIMKACGCRLREQLIKLLDWVLK